MGKSERQPKARWKYLTEPLPDWVRGSIQDRFSQIYRRRFWEEQESLSGPGSSLAQAGRLIEELPRLWERLGVESILDVPCGDFNWMTATDLSRVRYLGGEIVSELVNLNRSRYGTERIRFEWMDMTEQVPAGFDLVLCRDGLVHLSYGDIFRALKAFQESGATWLMTTTFPRHDENRDIETGDWRPLNLENPPFRFPSPLQLLVEGCPEESFEDKALGLWSLALLSDPDHLNT